MRWKKISASNSSRLKRQNELLSKGLMKQQFSRTSSNLQSVWAQQCKLPFSKQSKVMTLIGNNNSLWPKGLCSQEDSPLEVAHRPAYSVQACLKVSLPVAVDKQSKPHQILQMLPNNQHLARKHNNNNPRPQLKLWRPKSNPHQTSQKRPLFNTSFAG
jgi:hypothetical protein